MLSSTQSCRATSIGLSWRSVCCRIVNGKSLQRDGGSYYEWETEPYAKNDGDYDYDGNTNDDDDGDDSVGVAGDADEHHGKHDDVVTLGAR